MNKPLSIVSINLGNFASTGGIMMNISACARKKSYNTYHVYPGDVNNKAQHDGDIVICSNFEKKLYQRICRYSGRNGCSAYFATKKLLKKFDQIKPALLHLHNLHNSYINLPLLFNYIKKNHIPVVWTLHDCWAFTGHCTYFTFAKCDKWKTGCHSCPQYKKYPESSFDDSTKMYQLKQQWFKGVQNMVLVTPSQWLCDLAKQSFLKEYPIKVIHNGIDLSVFKPTVSDFRGKYHIPKEKRIVLGLAFGWGERKGLDVMIRLAEQLPDNYQVVLVGTNDLVDQLLPENIISIHRTKSRHELAELYSAADLLVNPTREENFPTVNMECLACGTPILTFNTGGSPEIIDEKTGFVVDCDDFDALYNELIRICETVPYKKEDCLSRATKFDMNQRFEEYVDLFEKVIRVEKET